MDLPTHGTDPLCCLVNPFDLAKTAGLPKVMQKTSPLFRVAQNWASTTPYPLPIQWPPFLCYSPGVAPTAPNGTHTSEQGRTCKSLFQPAQSARAMQPQAEMFLLRTNVPFTSRRCSVSLVLSGTLALGASVSIR